MFLAPVLPRNVHSHSTNLKTAKVMKFLHLKHKVRNFLNVVISDTERKNVFRIIVEYIVLLITGRDTANQYFTKFLYRKEHPPREMYKVSDRILHKCWDMNDPVYLSILGDKYIFERFFTGRGIRVAVSRAHNCNTLFFIDDGIIRVDSFDGFLNVMKDLASRSPSDAFIIKKRSGSSSGKSVFRLGFDEISRPGEKVRQIYHEVLKSEFMIQDYLHQHQVVNTLNPGCLNTIRMDSFTNRDGKSAVYSAFLRMGLNTSHVDNIGSGGAYVGVSLEDGTLRKTGFSDFSHGGGRVYLVNPKSDIPFEGYKIPYFREALGMVTRAAELVPRLKIVGWDMAILPDGPMIIEANEHPGLTHSEVAHLGFGDNPVFSEILDELHEFRMKEKRVRKTPGMISQPVR